MITHKLFAAVAALIFLAGLFLGKAAVLAFIIAGALAGAGAWFLWQELSDPAVRTDKKKEKSDDDPPPFVKEEVLDGVTDTSMKCLTPEYKKKIRAGIEEAIVETLGALLEVLKAAVPYHTAALFRRGKTDVLYLFLYNSESRSVALGETIGYGVGLVGQIAREKEGRMVYEGDVRTPATTLAYYTEDEEIRTFMGVPITIDGVCRGAVVVDSKKESAFSEREREIIQIFARIAGTIQYYSYLQLENRIDRNKVTALSSFQRKFFKLGSEPEIIALLGEILKTLIQAARISVSLESEKTGFGEIRFIDGPDADFFTGYTFPFSEKGLVSLVFEKNALVKRRFDPGRYVPRFSVREKVNHDIKSVIAVPIPSSNNDRCIGVIALESAVPNHFTEIDTENIQNLALSTGLALEKIKMLTTQTQLATIDGLTGLPNHREFQNWLEARFKRAKRQNSELGLIICDIDHFKKVNDTHGHPAGDQILKAVATILKGSIRKDVDFVARYGGEEFACVVESGENMTLETAERIRQQIKKTPFDLGTGQQLSVTMSLGVAVFPIHASRKQELIDRADKALYEAKRSGRNCVKKY